MIPPSSLAFPLLERHPCWSTCGRRTRPFSGRAFREHRTNMGVLPILFIVRVLRARRMVWRITFHPSQAARCASTEDHQAPSPPLFCEQKGRLATPLTPLPLPPGHAAQRPLFVHRDQPRPRGHLSPFARSSEPPEGSPPVADAESATQKLDRWTRPTL